MRASVCYLNPAEAARRLGVSVKALRLYEQRGLVTPLRTAAGWRAYGPDNMARVGEIVALRALGLSLARIADVLGGDARALEPALAAHQAALEGQVRQLAGAVDKVRDLRADLARGRAPQVADLTWLATPTAGPDVAFDLPWPWGGERFTLRDIGALTFLTGPLGSGKTRLALGLAEALPGAVFLGLDRSAADGALDPAHALRVEAALRRVRRSDPRFGARHGGRSKVIGAWEAERESRPHWRSERRPGPRRTSRSSAVIVVIQHGERLAGVLVDGVQETFQVDASVLQEPPQIETTTPDLFVDAIIPIDDRLLSRLVVSALLPAQRLAA